jgi:hypothetical protein
LHRHGVPMLAVRREVQRMVSGAASATGYILRWCAMKYAVEQEVEDRRSIYVRAWERIPILWDSRDMAQLAALMKFDSYKGWRVVEVPAASESE